MTDKWDQRVAAAQKAIERLTTCGDDMADRMEDLEDALAKAIDFAFWVERLAEERGDEFLLGKARTVLSEIKDVGGFCPPRRWSPEKSAKGGLW